MVHILKGTQFYRMFIALVLYVHKFGRQEARNVTDNADYVENCALPHTQI